MYTGTHVYLSRPTERYRVPKSRSHRTLPNYRAPVQNIFYTHKNAYIHAQHSPTSGNTINSNIEQTATATAKQTAVPPPLSEEQRSDSEQGNKCVERQANQSSYTIGRLALQQRKQGTAISTYESELPTRDGRRIKKNRLTAVFWKPGQGLVFKT